MAAFTSCRPAAATWPFLTWTGKRWAPLAVRTRSRRFRSTGIATDSAGNLYLGGRCAIHRFRCCEDELPCLTGTIPLPADPSAIAFDLHGNLLVLSPAQKKALQFPVTAFEQEGTFLSEPLDSELYRCQWHSVVLEGEIPNGARVLARDIHSRDAAGLDRSRKPRRHRLENAATGDRAARMAPGTASSPARPAASFICA